MLFRSCKQWSKLNATISDICRDETRHAFLRATRLALVSTVSGTTSFTDNEVCKDETDKDQNRMPSFDKGSEELKLWDLRCFSSRAPSRV